jgi:hypothetical protein
MPSEKVAPIFEVLISQIEGDLPAVIMRVLTATRDALILVGEVSAM